LMDSWILVFFPMNFASSARELRIWISLPLFISPLVSFFLYHECCKKSGKNLD
jgi:hypothetical protein